MESHLGERLPPRIAGRILLRHAGLGDSQREALAVKYNSMLTFEQAANALRSLDRPDALVAKVSKSYVTTKTEVEDENDEMDENEEDELVADEGDTGPESDGHGNLMYLMLTQSKNPMRKKRPTSGRTTRLTKMCAESCKLVAKVVSSSKLAMVWSKRARTRGKGQPKEKGKANSFRSGQGRGHGQRGTPEELVAKTRCFSCGQFGHMSEECPIRNNEQSNNFFVCQGSSGGPNRTYFTTSVWVNISETKEKQFSVFFGVQIQGHEAVVDTPAEEAVIGSSAMPKLRESLAHFGLQPVQAPGATVTCAGIGGSAKIVGVFDMPLWVAKTNGLIRVTEISNEGPFTTPFLLPISYIELATSWFNSWHKQRAVYIEKRQQQLNSTPMRRAPSGHRTISVLDFAGKWNVPVQLHEELKFKGGANPFFLPRCQGRRCTRT